MKKFILTIAITTISTMASADTNSFKEGVKGVVSSVVSASKDAISGLNDGINDGRKSGESVDGAVIISDKETLNQYVTVSIPVVKKINDSEYKITLAIRNKTDNIVRLTNLNERKSLQLLDNDGFVSYLKPTTEPIESDITIPEQAAIRVHYEFSDVEGVPALLRLYGMEIEPLQKVYK